MPAQNTSVIYTEQISNRKISPHFSSVEINFHECISLKFNFAILLVSDLKKIKNFKRKITANKTKVGWETGLEGINTSSLITKTFMATET